MEQSIFMRSCRIAECSLSFDVPLGATWSQFWEVLWGLYCKCCSCLQRSSTRSKYSYECWSHQWTVFRSSGHRHAAQFSGFSRGPITNCVFIPTYCEGSSQMSVSASQMMLQNLALPSCSALSGPVHNLETKSMFPCRLWLWPSLTFLNTVVLIQFFP